MSKRTYRTKNVQHLSVETVFQQAAPGPLQIGIDVAKNAMVAALGMARGEPVESVRFEHPGQTRLFLQKLKEVQNKGLQIQVALEPTGSYGDALSYQLDLQDVQVYRINPKKVHDYKEVLDGVPSQHDAKDAAVILTLHQQGHSRRWVPMEQRRRDVRALVTQRELQAGQLEALHNQLEALLAVRWPELEQVLQLRQRTTGLKLLATYGTPDQVEAQAQAVLELLHRESRGRLPEHKRNEVVAAAKETLGVPASAAERTLMRGMAEQILQTGRRLQELDEALAEELRRWPEVAEVVQRWGSTTTAILVANLGNLGAYESTGALEKSCGLNLKEQSSGKYQSPLHVTKRGPAPVRKYLYLAALRWIQWDEVARAWYERRSCYRNGASKPALVALMRKLLSALWHVTRGSSYDPTRLFDVSRLNVSSACEGAPPAQEPVASAAQEPVASPTQEPAAPPAQEPAAPPAQESVAPQKEAPTAPTGAAASPKAPAPRRPMGSRGKEALPTPTGPTAPQGAVQRAASAPALRRGEGDKWETGGSSVTGGRPGGAAGVRDTGGCASGGRPGPCAPAQSTAPAGGLSR